MSNPSVQDLTDELITRVKSTTTFADSGFSAYNLQDLQSWREAGASLPIAGISYEGCEVLSNEISTSRNTPGSKSVNTLRMRFSVIIGVDYRGAGGPDTKVTAFSLLQEVRDVLHGYSSIGHRPWSFVYERPLDGDSTEGVIFYGQLWMTDVILTGNHTEN